jgi:sulfite reductase alpha subunit-like flavoprotein
VRQFGFDISEYDLSYSAGDSLGVFATNDPAVVDAWLAATGMRAEHVVEVDGTELTLREALISHYDICRVTPNLMRFISQNSRDAKALRAPKDKLNKWLVGRNGLDLVQECVVHADPDQWQAVLVRLTPRNYSISSSPLVSPHEVQLTVSVVRYRGADGGQRGGVCSTFLADRAVSAPVFLQRSPHFRPPEDEGAPMIMVGPGTGIAPFRGFLQERRALGHTGRNWLFFGDQHRSQNFYYRDDFEDMVRDGLLNRLDLAFSRDQADRIYVQHKMIDYGADLWRWLDDGAHFYVCGDAARMARDVDAALTTIIEEHGGMSHENAHDYKRELVAAKRYIRDVY